MPRTVSARDVHIQGVHYARTTFSFSDTAAVLIGVVPAYSLVVSGGVAVTTAFNASLTNTANVGTTADPDGFATLLALGVVGVIALDEMATSNDFYVTEDTAVYVTPVMTGTAATTGVAHAWIEFLPNH